MEQSWFEMRDIRRRHLNAAVWIPLRAVDKIQEIGKYGELGYQSEFFGIGTLAVPIEGRSFAEKLGWTDVGISLDHSGCVDRGKYIPSDVYDDYTGKFSGLHLALEQRGNALESSSWHLHQDFAITLGLRREGDIWVRPDEGYIEVAKLSWRPDGRPRVLEVRASHLKDYLCARGMGLYATSYRQRLEIVETVPDFPWRDNPITESEGADQWEGRIDEIHEGGMPFGAQTAVFHVSRTDVDHQADVPVFGLPNDENLTSKSWTKSDNRRKLYRIQGELWRNDWITPASASPMVRRDSTPPTVYFVVDSEGKQEAKNTLSSGGRWLWFRPEVVSALAHRRGGHLNWYTRDTGDLGCSPDGGVPFGVNSLGLVTVYAKDIALLPDWQQRIWAGYNVSPEGKVCEELLMSQADAVPADTQAPEDFLGKALQGINETAQSNVGITLFRQHDQIPALLAHAHRFRATDSEGLFSLAKDLARLTADSLDATALNRIVSPPKGEKWGSLKSLEKLLSSRIGDTSARQVMGPLFGIYELRLADAHLPSGEIETAFSLIRVDRTAPYVTQGYQLLDACVGCLYAIYEVLSNWNVQKSKQNNAT